MWRTVNVCETFGDGFGSVYAAIWWVRGVKLYYAGAYQCALRKCLVGQRTIDIRAILVERLA